MIERSDKEADLNLYGFINNAPISLIDLLGLKWAISRDNKPYAVAEGDCGDTIDDLANIIGLSPSSYKDWIEAIDGLEITKTSSQKFARKRKFYIPNTVYAYWAGEAGKTGKWVVRWNSSVSYLNQLGFKVIELDHRAGDKRFLQGILTHAASGKTLHGLYFWGHGYSPYPSSGLTSPTGDPVVMYSEINLVYRMALGLVFACDTNSGKNALFSNAPGGIWNGYSRTLVPFFKFFHVDNWIKSGDQGTK